ncbi:hypothetical protein LTR96_003373 [Exophiala xenobiotica]|nr:hypothetical protein LTR96_003373 [Exophiala xenobiotica]KAK5342785.1 hypothetical protein LTR98_000411 [Exophiala xenobiotica]
MLALQSSPEALRAYRITQRKLRGWTDEQSHVRYPRTRNGQSGGAKRSEGQSTSARSTASTAPSEHVDVSTTTIPLEKSPVQWMPDQLTDTLTSTHAEVLQQQPPTASPMSTVQSAKRTESFNSVDGPEMLFARMAEVQPGAIHDSPSDIREQSRMLYLGETFTLAFVVKTVCSPSGCSSDIRNHYPIPVSVADRLDRREDESDPAPCFSQHEEVFLQAQGAFTTPTKELSDELVAVFFRYFHPAWPVFDRRLFVTLYDRNEASLLVLQTIYFIAVSICDDDLLDRVGFTDRYQARRVFYLRAKGLYDADYEKDKVILAAVLFLLGFWWQGPEDQKDTWHWVGCAISLAQTLGMHRSTARSGIDARQRSLWKRIFWSIYTRDRHAAAALGRPVRIHDQECDVEELCEADFDLDMAPASKIMISQERYHAQYPIAMSKLAKIFGRIILTRYTPHSHNTPLDAKLIGDDLSRWKRNLPPEMLLQDIDEAGGAGFWACMLHANYQTCQILLFRPSRVMVETDEEIQYDAIARSAADGMTRIAEDLLTSGTLRQAQVHLAPALFAACGMHAIMVRRKSAIHSQLAETRARQCMLALSELAKSWPVAGWILRLFVSLMTRLTGHLFDPDPGKWCGTSAGAGATSVAAAPPQHQFGLLNGNGSVVHPEQQQPGFRGGLSHSAAAEKGFEAGPGHGYVPHNTLAPEGETASYPNDLGSEDLDWIFQDSLDGFSLYDLGLASGPANPAF